LVWIFIAYYRGTPDDWDCSWEKVMKPGGFVQLHSPLVQIMNKNYLIKTVLYSSLRIYNTYLAYSHLNKYLHVSRTCPITANRKGRILPKISARSYHMPTRYSDTGLCSYELGGWIFWNPHAACFVFGQETNEPSDFDDIYVF
jgi:hypothetical protein